MIEELIFKKSHKCYISKKSNNSNFCKECGIFIFSKSADLNKKLYRTPFFAKEKNTSSLNNSELSYLFKKEKKNKKKLPKGDYNLYHSKITNWIKYFSEKLEFSQKTLHLAISYINKIFYNFKVLKKEMEIVSFTCLNLAAKMEEKSDKIPSLKNIIEFFDFKFSEEKFKNCEKEVFKHLNYDLNKKTTLDFFNNFSFRGIINGKDLLIKNIDQALIKYQLILFEEISFHLLEYSLFNFEFLKFKASALASIIIACARKIIGFENFWNENLEESTFYGWKSIRNGANFFLNFYVRDCMDKYYYFLEKAEFVKNQKIRFMFEIEESLELKKRKDSILTQCGSESTLEEDLNDFQDKKKISL